MSRGSLDNIRMFENKQNKQTFFANQLFMRTSSAFATVIIYANAPGDSIQPSPLLVLLVCCCCGCDMIVSL